MNRNFNERSGRRDFDRNTERTARREYGLDDSYDRNMNRPRNMNSYDEDSNTDRDFNLNGNRNRDNWGTERTAREEYGVMPSSDRKSDYSGYNPRSNRNDSTRYAGRFENSDWGKSSERDSFRSEEGWNSSRIDRSGHYGKGPKGWKRSDDKIREDVSEALHDSWQVDASDIDISVKDGFVSLKGTVDTREAKRAAEQCAENVRGVEDVQNEIRVKKNENVADLNRNQPMGKTGSLS